jgi:hypothetical protein
MRMFSAITPSHPPSRVNRTKNPNMGFSGANHSHAHNIEVATILVTFMDVFIEFSSGSIAET